MEKLIIKKHITNRGGTVTLDLSSLGHTNCTMTAYQNYLGGGMLGRVCCVCNVSKWQKNAELKNLSTKLKKYLHNITNPSDSWESMSYENNQKLPESSIEERK